MLYRSGARSAVRMDRIYFTSVSDACMSSAMEAAFASTKAVSFSRIVSPNTAMRRTDTK